MRFTVLLCLSVLACVCLGEKRTLKPIDDFSFKSFLKLFRTSILDEIARQWNITIAQAEVLQKQMSTCNPKIQTRVNICKNCTSKLCKDQPSFVHYLNQDNPMDSLNVPLETLGNGLGDVVLLLGTESFGFLDAVKGITVQAGTSLGDGMKNVANELVHDLGKLPDLVSDGSQYLISGLGDISTSALDGIKDLGGSIGDGFKDAGLSIAHGISSIFGRRRRSYDAATRECMNRCDDVCWQLMTDDNAVMISNVCGSFVVTLNKTVHRTINKVMSLYNATLDTTSPVITKIEIDDATIDTSTMSVSTLFITANIHGQETRFQSSAPYYLMNLPTTAKMVAKEFWRMWT